MFTLMTYYIGAGLVLAALSVPLILRRIPPNGLYGFRVKATLEDPALWYAVNAYAGWRLLGAGLGTVAAAILLVFVPGQTIDGYALSCLGVVAILLGLGLAQSVLFLKSRSRAKTQ